jgi:cysteinyl-tRNA synthetase
MQLFEKYPVHITNSLTRNKEPFVPVNAPFVGMYVCGPTVYNYLHLGNCRTFISFDMMYRYLKHLGYKVRYVRNITDAGHLENDADQGEDKISQRARLERLEPMEIVQKYTLYFHDIMRQFNALSPDIEPTATGHIVEQIEMIKVLIDKGLAYEENGSVYFNILKYNESFQYGELSGREIEELLAGSRDLDGQNEKRDSRDFALWKKASPSHIMRWPSPWSDGFPGWHLECSAMSRKYLGEHFDIHGGGMDLKFPHHECEIAQNQGTCGHKSVNFWIHGNMLTLNGKKMSKSTGNTLLPDELFLGTSPLLPRPYHPMVVRFFMMQAHYGSTLDFSGDALDAAEKAYERLIKAMETLEHIKPAEKTDVNANEIINGYYQAMSDDFNAPVLVARLFETVKLINSVNDGKQSIDEANRTLLLTAMRQFVVEILGVQPVVVETDDTDLQHQLIQLLIDLRADAKNARNFLMADTIRNRLKEAGIEIRDSKEGTTYDKLKG